MKTMTVSQATQTVSHLIYEDDTMLTSCALSVVVLVNWTISQAVSVTEGDTVVLRAEVFGVYAIPLAIGVKTIATNVQPGMDTIY